MYQSGMREKSLDHQQYMSHPKGRLPSLLRGYRILEQIAANVDGVSATDLARQLSMAKATVHRIALTMESEGLLQRDPYGKKYFVGRRLRNFSLSVLSNSLAGEAIHLILQSLAEDIGETCNCAVLDGLRIVYYDRVETNWPMRIQLPVGSHLPLHCTASGKLFLAYMSKSQRTKLLKTLSLRKYTEHTITDWALLEKELKSTREQEMGIDRGEFLQGMVAIAVPAKYPSGDFRFTLAVHSPIVRKDVNSLLEYLPFLRKAAEQLANIDS